MTKNCFQSMIHTYTQRRRDIKKIWFGKPEYAKKVSVINRKLKSWKRSIKIIELKEKRLRVLDRLVMEYLDTPSLFHIGPFGSKEIIKAKRLFFKYGLENGFKGPLLESYIGIKPYTNVAVLHRKRFTKSFNTKPQNKELWHKFLNYAKNR